MYAWALLPNHFHLLVRTGRHPLARSMRSLLTGYAGAFNRRSRRSGHVLQNRYQSVVCDEAVYCLALVRSLHLKPVRARSVAALEGVAQSADSGHGALVRQAKLGASCGVKVPAEEGLPNHSYRVLQLWRKPRCRAERHR